MTGGSANPTVPEVLDDPSSRRPAGLCAGPGHRVVYGNAAFREMFGEASVGLPARESMLGLPSAAFAVLDSVLASGRPLARWVHRKGEDWRLTVAPRADPGTGELYGVRFHLRARSDPLTGPGR